MGFSRCSPLGGSGKKLRADCGGITFPQCLFCLCQSSIDPGPGAGVLPVLTVLAGC